MNPLPFLGVLAGVALWSWLVYSRSPRRKATPAYMAFSATAVAALFLLAGFAGFNLSTRHRFLTGTAWSDGVIWWQVGIGLALVPLVVYFWRRAMSDIDRRLNRT